MNGEQTDAAPVSLVDLIDGLAEPPEPAPIPLTPETWGWAALALLLVSLAAVALWRWRAHRRANAYRRAALAELAQAATAAEVAAILRRAALASAPRGAVASLTGDAWVAFLERSGPGPWPDGARQELRTAPWRNETAPPSPALRHAAERWIRRHDRRVTATEAPGPSGQAAA